MRLYRDRTGRPQLEPKRRQCRSRTGALQLNRTAGPVPLHPRILLECAIVADSLAHRADLIGHRLVDQRLGPAPGRLTRAPATERLVSPRVTWPARLGSKVPGRGKFWAAR